MADFTSGATGALGGASTGLAVGGPIGAVAGGLIGGIAGLFGKGKKRKKLSTFDKQQKKLNKYQHQAIMGKGPLADLYNYDPEAANQVFDKTIANKAYRDLQERAIPSVTGQFRNQGLMTSSYAGDAIAKLARDVQESLDAQRTNYLYGQQQAAQEAKRKDVNALQDRQTIAYGKSNESTGLDINKVLESFTPERISQAKNYFET